MNSQDYSHDFHVVKKLINLFIGFISKPPRSLQYKLLNDLKHFVHREVCFEHTYKLSPLEKQSLLEYFESMLNTLN